MQIAPERIAVLDSRIRDDPEFFLRDILGGDPWEMQVEILEALRDFPRVAVRTCHAAGKDWIAARCALWFLISFRPSKVITTGPTGRQVHELLWRELRKAYNDARVPLGGHLYLTSKLDFAEDWFAIGFATDESVSFQGFHSENILFIGDEASGITEEVYEGADTILSTENARELLIGQPLVNSGRFYDAFHTNRAMYKGIQVPASATPNFQGQGVVRPYLITPRWVEDMRSKYGEQSAFYQARVLAEFPSSAADQMIPLAWVDKATWRQVAIPTGTPYVLGCDVARFGDDQTVICTRQGDVGISLEDYQDQDTMVTAGKLINALKARDGKAVWVEADGLGAGVVDRLREQGWPVGSISAGGRASDPDRFTNRRSELYWQLRERFQEGRIQVPQDQELIAQLTSIKYNIRSDGRIEVESKDEMKKRGLKSPDRADALMLAFAGGPIEAAKTAQENAFTRAYFGSGRRKKRPSRGGYWIKPGRSGR